MQDSLEDIAIRARQAWPYRWQGLLVACIVAAAATFVVLLLPDVYTSTVRIAVSDDPDTGSTPSAVHDAELRLLSDETLNGILKQNDFGMDVKTPAALDRARKVLRSKLNLDGVDETEFAISCADRDPKTAREICLLVLAAFEAAILANDVVSDGTLEQQQVLLNDAERKLDAFRRDHLDVFGQGGIDVRLDTARATLDAARAAYQSAITRRDRLQESLNTGGNIDRVEPPGGDPQIDRLYTLFNTLQTLRARYSEDHPDVILAKRDVETIVRQYPPTVRMCVDNQPAAPPVSVEVAPITSASIAVVAANIAVCRALDTLTASQQNVRDLSAINDSAFPIKQELTRLTTERDRIKDRVDDLIDRMRPDGSVVNSYSVIEAPSVAGTPSSPNRRILLLATLFGSAVAGVFVTYLRGLAANTIVRASEVERDFGLPLYGSVSIVDGLRAQIDRSAQVFSFSTASGALAAVLVVLILADPWILAARQWVTSTVDTVVGSSEQGK